MDVEACSRFYVKWLTGSNVLVLLLFVCVCWFSMKRKLGSHYGTLQSFRISERLGSLSLKLAYICSLHLDSGRAVVVAALCG